jgi:Flp pilus assembly protein protease CpaA
MYELIILALIFTLFAVVQDLRTREVANWLNFSLIAFALAFRLFHALLKNSPEFFYIGLIGLAVFIALAYILYYARAFAGGDAKLLMGFGVILPYNSYADILPLTLIFIFLLFLSGAVYSIIYSVFIAAKNKKKLKSEASKNVRKNPALLITSPILFLASLFILSRLNYLNSLTVSAIAILFILVPWVWIYTKSLEKCMTKIYPPSKLTEGDWLDSDVFLNKKILVKKTVHGLSLKDIALIKKHNLSVKIKEGIPFTPAFLIALLIITLFSETILTFFQGILYII